MIPPANKLDAVPKVDSRSLLSRPELCPRGYREGSASLHSRVLPLRRLSTSSLWHLEAADNVHLNSPPIASWLWTLCIACFLVLCSCSDEASLQKAEELPLQSVQTLIAKEQSAEQFEEVPGVVAAKLKATVESKVGGRIIGFSASIGKLVAAAELLVELDAAEIEAQLEQAQAVQAQAKRDLNRFQALLAQKAVTPIEFDAAEARLRVSQATVSEAKAVLESAGIRAPFSGVITRKFADVGDLALPGRPLFEIEAASALRFEANVPESLLPNVKTGAELTVAIQRGSAIETLTGPVVEVAAVADPNSRTFLVKIDLPLGSPLSSGQFGYLAVPLQAEPSLRLPVAAVVRRGQLELVFVVEEMKARLRLVRSGRRFGTEIEIVSGISDGEIVVVKNAERLQDGQPVGIDE